MADPTIPAAPSTPTPPAAAPAATQPPAADPKPTSVGEKFAALKNEARAKAAPAPAPVAAKAPADPDLAAAERILAEDRRVKDTAKKVEADRAATAADRAAWEAQKAADKAVLDAAKAAAEARSKGDVIGVLKAMGFSDDDIYSGDESILFKLAEAKVKAPELSQTAQIEAAIAAKLAEKEEADAAARAAKTKEAEDTAAAAKQAAEAFAETAKEAYSKGVLAIAKENPSKYPALSQWNVQAGVITEYAWNVLVQSEGKLTISEEEALADVEAHYAQMSKAAAGGGVEEKKPEPQQHRGVSINPSWQSQTGAPARAAPPDMKGKYEALKEEARRKFAAR